MSGLQNYLMLLEYGAYAAIGCLIALVIVIIMIACLIHQTGRPVQEPRRPYIPHHNDEPNWLPPGFNRNA